MSIGAVHYYGELRYDDKESQFGFGRIGVSRTLTQADADKINEEDDWASYSAGDTSSRFYTKDDVIEAGIKTAREKFGDDIILRLNSFTSAQCERTIYAPEHIMAELKPVEDAWFALWDSDPRDYDPWETHKDALPPINRKWFKINKKYDIGKQYV